MPRDRKDEFHRRVGEVIAGRKLRLDEIVHHKDENKANNTRQNLVIVPRGRHTTDHNRSRPLSKLRQALRGEKKVY